jgi:hypothetical protein
MPRRTAATRFSQCGFISMRADSGDGSDVIASTGRADDDLSARLAFDELATRKVSFSLQFVQPTMYVCQDQAIVLLALSTSCQSARA